MKAEASSTQRLIVSSSGKSRLNVLVRVLQWPELIQHQIFVERMKESKHLHPVLLCIICSEKGGAGYSSSGVQSAGRPEGKDKQAQRKSEDLRSRGT